MKQPELGLKVTNLRQSKGMTQEQLAEYCEVSARTIQRIESGEADPRTFTLNNLSEALEYDFNAPEAENENLWLALLHLSGIISNVIFPLLIWSWKKNKSYKINQHGKDVLNFQVTITLILFSGLFFLMALAPLGIPYFDETSFAWTGFVLLATSPMLLVITFSFYQGVVNAARVLNDSPYHYPLSIKFLK